MSTQLGRLVWTFANAINRLPWVCWPDMVTWALDLTHWRDERKSRRALTIDSLRDLVGIVSNRNSVSQCKADALRCDTCYCAKFQTVEFQREHVPAHCKPGITVTRGDA